MKKVDRLTSLVSHFEIETDVTEDASSANLLILGKQDQPDRLFLNTTPSHNHGYTHDILAAVQIDFGGQANPVVAALPEFFSIHLHDAPEIRGVADLILAEINSPRCGRQIALDRLCEFLIIKVLRIHIVKKNSKTGVFAGLAHPNLCPALVAIHDNPERDWKLDDFVEMSGLCRTGFIESFGKIVGTTPMAYLKNWRLTLARNAICNGKRVKETALRFGYGSGDAFTRAFTSAYGLPPTSLANQANRKDNQLS